MRFRFMSTSSYGQRIGKEVANHACEQAQAPCIHDQKEKLTTKHSAPRAEYIRCAF